MPSVATEDTTVGGLRVSKEAVLSLCYASANRDDRQFAEPDSFDIARKNLAKHMTFSQAIHRCVGTALVRGELQAVLQEIVRQIDTITIEDEGTFPREHSIMGRRLTSLPVKITGRALGSSS